MTAGFPYLSAILLTPGLGLLVILFLPRNRDDLVRWVSLVSAGLCLLQIGRAHV